MRTVKDFQSIDTFATKRLIAKKIVAEDIDKFLLMHTDLSVMETLGGLRTTEQTNENLAWNLEQWQNHGFGFWMFYLKDTHEWIGRGGLRRVEVDGHEEVELGYALMPAFWHQGFATEIANACVEIAFEVIRLDNIVSFTPKTNTSSKRVMEKIGLQHEKEFLYVELPHDLYRMKNPFKIAIAPYDKRWPEFFKLEVRHIKNLLGDHLKEIYHIGSTAIPNMPAKPVIDILLVCENVDNINIIAEQLKSLHYFNLRRQIIPHRSFFTQRQESDISFNLHIYERGCPQIKRHVNFRDYVSQHPDVAKAYAELKLKLADQFRDNRSSYVSGKDKLVQEIDAKAKLWSGRKTDYLPPNPGPLANSWSHEKLVKAMAANLNVHMTHFAQYLNQIELIRIPGFTIVNSGLSDDTFNYVLDADFPPGEAKRKIAEVTPYFIKRNMPFSWWISPHDKPNDLSKQLEYYNYQNTENNTAMYFDLDAWDGLMTYTPKLEIICARDEKSLHDFALVLANDVAAFKQYYSWIASVLADDDPIEYYVGYVDGKPVVRGLTCYYAQVAGLHWLSTAPDERKKGYGTAMQKYRLKRAKDLGYHIAVLQASGEGRSLYKKLDYKECGSFKEYKYR